MFKYRQKIAQATLLGIILVVAGAWWFKTRPVQASAMKTTPPVSMTQALATVLAANPGTAAVDVNLETEQQGLAWEVELNNDLEVYVDANTNEIIKTEQGWDLTDTDLLRDWIPN